MMDFQKMFVRYGWMLEQKGSQVFDCSQELSENVAFLLASLEEARVAYQWSEPELKICGTGISEEKWLQIVDCDRGRSELIGRYGGEHKPDLMLLDTYIAGIVRQLNRLGVQTTCSCDGHGRRSASIYVTKHTPAEVLRELLQVLSGKRVMCRESANSCKLIFRQHERVELLDLAEKLSKLEADDLFAGKEEFDMKQFSDLLETLLNIPGKSGNESKVRAFVHKQLAPYVDHMTVDSYGNLLAEKSYGNAGPTILLNAHLDTVYEIEADRVIEKDGTIWRSSQGILGADDRAGVAVVLKLAQLLASERIFNGKVKFIFTVEEEVGLVGARHVEEHFLWDVDAAFVVDRRGSGDIVTHNGAMDFCSEQFGKLVADTALIAGLQGWKCVMGGSSDTAVWAGHGIDSVNLSAGYGREHTAAEYVDVEACYAVTKLLAGVFARSRELRLVQRDRAVVGR